MSYHISSDIVLLTRYYNDLQAIPTMAANAYRQKLDSLPFRKYFYVTKNQFKIKDFSTVSKFRIRIMVQD